MHTNEHKDGENNGDRSAPTSTTNIVAGF